MDQPATSSNRDRMGKFKQESSLKCLVLQELGIQHRPGTGQGVSLEEGQVIEEIVLLSRYLCCC